MTLQRSRSRRTIVTLASKTRRANNNGERQSPNVPNIKVEMWWQGTDRSHTLLDYHNAEQGVVDPHSLAHTGRSRLLAIRHLRRPVCLEEEAEAGVAIKGPDWPILQVREDGALVVVDEERPESTQQVDGEETGAFRGQSSEN